jgi:hypothetical protein
MAPGEKLRAASQSYCNLQAFNSIFIVSAQAHNVFERNGLRVGNSVAAGSIC